MIRWKRFTRNSRENTSGRLSHDFLSFRILISMYTQKKHFGTNSVSHNWMQCAEHYLGLTVILKRRKRMRIQRSLELSMMPKQSKRFGLRDLFIKNTAFCSVDMIKGPWPKNHRKNFRVSSKLLVLYVIFQVIFQGGL